MILHDDYIRIAVITGAHGLTGRLKVYVISDVPDRFDVGNSVYLEKDNNYIEFHIREYKVQKGKTALMQLEGIEDRNAALQVKGNEVYIPRSCAEQTRDEFLDDGSFYYYDLIGCSVFIDNMFFGNVVDIMEAGAGEVLVIEDDKKARFMVPFVESMIETVSIAEKRIDIIPVEGLFDI